MSTTAAQHKGNIHRVRIMRTNYHKAMRMRMHIEIKHISIERMTNTASSHYDNL